MRRQAMLMSGPFRKYIRPVRIAYRPVRRAYHPVPVPVPVQDPVPVPVQDPVPVPVQEPVQVPVQVPVPVQSLDNSHYVKTPMVIKKPLVIY